MLTIDWDLLQPMLTKVLTVVQKLLLKYTGENAHKNYDIVLPWKRVAWPDIWNGFVDGVIIPYLKRGLGNVCNKPPPGGMAATDARANHLMRGHLRFCPRKCLTSYRVSSLENIGRVLCASGSSWQIAMTRWCCSMSSLSVGPIGGSHSSTSSLYHAWRPSSLPLVSSRQMKGTTCSTCSSPGGSQSCHQSR